MNLGINDSKMNFGEINQTIIKSNKRYTPTKLKHALRDIRSGKLKVLEACKLYSIPRTTLYFKLSGGRPEEFCRPGPPAILGRDVENKIESWLLDNYKRGFPLTKGGLMYSVKTIIEKYPENLIHKLPFKDNMPGRKWFASFKSRHPKIMEKLGERRNLTKVNLTEPKIRAWFSQAKSLIEEEGVTEAMSCPDRVFYMDEMCMYLNTKGDLLFTDKKKAVYSVSQHYVDNVTILFAVNAEGNFVPPAAVYKIKDLPNESISSVPSHWGIGYTKSGWMNCETFHSYITDVFYPFLLANNTEFPIVIFLDGNFSCMSLPLSAFCEEHGIVLMCTLPKAVHFLQPLHGFFSLIRTVWKNESAEWMNEHMEENEKVECHIPPLIDCILEKKIFESTIVDGFRLCKLFPFDLKSDERNEETNHDFDVINPKKECDCNLSIIEYVESKIPPEILSKFHACRLRGTPWTGYVGYSALYDIWSEVINENSSPQIETSKREDLLLDSEKDMLECYVLEEEIEEN